MNSDFLVDFPGLGIRDIPVNREIFSIFGQSVYWYGMLIALAIIVCLLLATKQAKNHQLRPDDIMDTFIVLIPMMILFARLYYVVFEWEYYAKDLTRVFNTRHGGLAFYGGVIGGALAFYLVARFKKLKFSRLIDYLAVYLPLGQAIGRLGNFFNQEAFGSNTTLPWGMYSNETERYLRMLGSGFDPAAPVHPTFLYEFLANIIIFVILLKMRKTVKTPYVMTFSYLGMYGFIRFFVEGIRTDALFIGDSSIRISQLLSALMVIVAIVFIVIARKRQETLLLRNALQTIESTDAIRAKDSDSSDFIDLKPEGKTGSDSSDDDFIEFNDDSEQDDDPNADPVEPDASGQVAEDADAEPDKDESRIDGV